MEQKTKLEIEIVVHKAEGGIRRFLGKIDSVSSRQADGIWYKEDFLMVSLSFDEAVESLLGFAVHLPVKRYGREEFLAKVKAEAEDILPKLLERDREEREKRKREQEKQEALDAIVNEIKSEVGLNR